MKKAHSLLVIILITSFFSISGFCQRSFSWNTYINGYWGEWQGPGYYGYVLNGTYDNFIIYSGGSHPSEYLMKVTIIGMPDEANKQAKKLMNKSDQWYEYTGTVEYFTNPEYPDIKKQITTWPSPYSLPKATNLNVTRKISTATIKVQPYKKNPYLYNIFFDEVGIGIQLQ